jgi:hypothetical protein
MPDNWGFVAAAYGLTAAVLLIYWRRLAKKERALDALQRSTAGQSRQRLNAERSHEPSRTGHPRPEAGSRPPLQ